MCPVPVKSCITRMQIYSFCKNGYCFVIISQVSKATAIPYYLFIIKTIGFIFFFILLQIFFKYFFYFFSADRKFASNTFFNESVIAGAGYCLFSQCCFWATLMLLIAANKNGRINFLILKSYNFAALKLRMKRIAIFSSGTGSNTKKIIDHLESLKDKGVSTAIVSL